MVIPFTVETIVIVLFCGLLVAAALNDVQSLTIPNQVCLSIAVLYPAYVLSAPQSVDWLGGLYAAGIAFIVGFLMFARGLLGGGDAKLIAAVMLWAGSQYYLDFLIIMGLVGGGLAVGVWLHSRYSNAVTPGMFFMPIPDPGLKNRKLPYGVAIGAGGLYVAFTLLRLV